MHQTQYGKDRHKQHEMQFWCMRAYHVPSCYQTIRSRIKLRMATSDRPWLQFLSHCLPLRAFCNTLSYCDSNSYEIRVIVILHTPGKTSFAGKASATYGIDRRATRLTGIFEDLKIPTCRACMIASIHWTVNSLHKQVVVLHDMPLISAWKELIRQRLLTYMAEIVIKFLMNSTE